MVGARTSHTFRPSLVHRLDRETSGIIVVALTKNALDKLSADFRNRKIIKEYTGICLGASIRKHGHMTEPIARLPDTNKVIIDTLGQEAHTEYWLQSGPPFVSDETAKKLLVVRYRLYTGRMHQIRVHSRYHGFVIAGDKTYASTTQQSTARKLGIHRQLLHATTIVFAHPVTNQETCISAPLPPDMTIWITT
jgi:23S rRNA pseudouridine1911/1915/1917 synthase